MLSKMDEYLIHQIDEPVAVTLSKDKHWDDSAYFFLHDDRGELVVFVTFEVFPNKGHSRALMLACCNGEHYRYVWDGPIDNDNRQSMVGGGIAFEVIEPGSVWRLTIADGENDIEANLTFTGRCPTNYLKPPRWHKGGNRFWHVRGLCLTG